jgi:hypothetical protein
MKPRVLAAIDRLADETGADGFTVVRASRHLIVIFHYADGDVRQVLSATPSDHNAYRNRRAELRRAIRKVG